MLNSNIFKWVLDIVTENVLTQVKLWNGLFDVCILYMLSVHRIHMWAFIWFPVRVITAQSHDALPYREAHVWMIISDVLVKVVCEAVLSVLILVESGLIWAANWACSHQMGPLELPVVVWWAGGEVITCCDWLLEVDLICQQHLTSITVNNRYLDWT